MGERCKYGKAQTFFGKMNSMKENGKANIGLLWCLLLLCECDREEEGEEEDEEWMAGGRRTDRETQTQHVCMARAKFF